MRQLARWDLCRFVKTLSYFGVIPLVRASWLQQLLGLPERTSLQQLDFIQAMTTGQTILTVTKAAMAEPLEQALANQGYQAYPISPNHIPEAIAQLPNEVRLTMGGAIGICPADGILDLGLEAISDLLAQQSQQRVLFDFRQLTDIDALWGPVDDVVMGGVSQSGIERGVAGAIFSGTVSTENSGGFASVRTRNLDPLDLSAYEGIQLRVRGDGNRYKFLLRDSDRWDGVAYSASFDTVPNSWMTVKIPFDELVPVFRARTLEDSDGINRHSVRAFQLMLSKFEYNGELNPTFEPGPFELAVDSIVAYGGTVRAVWLVPGSTESPLALGSADTVIRAAALGNTDSSSLSLTSSEPSGTLSTALAAELCVRVLETPALQNRTVAVQAGVGHPLSSWEDILASL
ncbi:MAG: CIA30 family protein [Elainellaceae cyanobacterium]